MSGSYWEPLADVLPEKVRQAMDSAVARTVHSADPREEPFVLAGVRSLLEHVVLRTEHDELIARWVADQRRSVALHAEQLADVQRRSQADVRSDLRKLEAIRALVYGAAGRKTLPVAELREALGIDAE